MTINDIISEIIEEVGGSTSDTVLSAKMLSFFKAGYRRLPAFVRDRNFLSEGTINLLTGSDTASLDGLGGFVREREVWYQEATASLVQTQGL